MYNNPMSGAAGSHYPHLPPPGSDIPMQPMSGGGAPYPSAPNYGPGQPPYPSLYPAPMTSQPPPVGFSNPQGPPAGMAPYPQGPPAAAMAPYPQGPPAGPAGEYNYPKTYVVVPPAEQNQQRHDSDAMDCCKCLLCCCGCIELCRCFSMCLKCMCDSD